MTTETDEFVSELDSLIEGAIADAAERQDPMRCLFTHQAREHRNRLPELFTGAVCEVIAGRLEGHLVELNSTERALVRLLIEILREPPRRATDE